MILRRAIFLDRDGVLNGLTPDPVSGLPESPLSLADVTLLPRVIEACHQLKSHGYLLVVVTNQPAAAKQKITIEDLAKVHEHVVELLSTKGQVLDDSRICFHHPDGSDPVLGRPCLCRKPRPGMILAAASELGIDLARSWTIGDSDNDVSAGASAGTRTILIEHPASSHRRSHVGREDARSADLGSAAEYLIGLEHD